MAVLTLIAFHVVHAQDESAPIRLEEITITPGRFTIYEGAEAKRTLSEEEINLFPLIDNDVFRAMQIFPGVVSNDYSARFNVRGGEKDEILARLDGMELFEPYHLQDFGGAISIIDLGLIRGADLLMGGFPAFYGDKMSGVMDITTKMGSREGVSLNLGIDLINANAMAEGPLSGKGSWLIAARRGYADLVLELIGADEELKPQFADVYGKIGYSLTEKDEITLNSIYAWDDNFIDEDDDDNDVDSTYHNAMFWAKRRRFFSDAAWSDAFLFSGFVTRDRRVGVDGIDERDFAFFGAKGEFTARALKKHTLRGGLEGRWTTAEYDYAVRERLAGVNQYERITATVDDSGVDFKAYLQDEWQIHPMLAVNVGARYIFQDYRRNGVQKYELSPRAAVAVSPSENLVVRGAWGLYHQPVDLMTIPVEDGIDDVGGAEEATHYVIGAEYILGDNLAIQAEAYYKKLENLVGQIRDFGRKTQFFTQPDSGNVKGFDLLIRRAFSERLTGMLGYAYAVAKEEADGQKFFREFDQRHTVVLNGTYQLGPTWSLHVGWRFHTGNPTTELTHRPVRLPDGALACDRQFGEIRADRLPAYHSLDFRLTKTTHYKNWTLNWYVQALNLYNRSNVHERAFSETRNEETGAIVDCEVSDEPLFPILPTLGVNAEF